MSLAQLLVRRLGVGLEDARNLVRSGGVYLGPSRVRIPSARVTQGQRVSAYVEQTEAREPLEPLRVLHRDPDFVIIDKVAGMPVAATREQASFSVSEAVRTLLQREGVVRPYVGVVHRLDQGATGLVLVTTRAAINPSLHRLFTEHRIHRTYRVRVRGAAPAEQHCRAPIVELGDGRGVRVAASLQEAGAKPAETLFASLSPRVSMPGTSLLEVRLMTGRTHQIRAHGASLGHPVVGDARYGGTAEADTALHLHAWRLEFDHPNSGAAIRVEAPLPAWAEASIDLESRQ